MTELYMVTLDWSTDDDEGLEQEFFTNYKEAALRFNEMIENEKNPNLSWVGDKAFDDSGKVNKDYELDYCLQSESDGNLYWNIVDRYDYYCHSFISLKKVKVEQNFAIRSDELRSICIKNNWFTNGSINQYTKLFELNDSGASLDELALIIWLCSLNTTKQEIINKLLETEND
jgi:hypothetical protein